MITYDLSSPDNGTYMCGSEGRLHHDEIERIPYCQFCGYKTDPFFINPNYRLTRTAYDLSSTYDNYTIASLKFKEACIRLELQGIEFLPLPADPIHFVVKATSVIAFDSVARNTRFERFCEHCGLFGDVVGAHPAVLKSALSTSFARADIFFGSGNARNQLLIASPAAKALLSKEKLKGLLFDLCRSAEEMTEIIRLHSKKVQTLS